MFPVGEVNCFGEKKTDFGATAAIKQQRQLCQLWDGAALVAAGGGVGYGVTMLTMEVVGNGGVGLVEGFVGCGQGKRNGRHPGGHW